MAGSVANLVFETKVDDKGLKNGLSSAERDVGDAGERSGGRFGNAIKTGLAVAGTALAAAGTAIGALVKQSVTAYSEYEQLVGGVQKLYGNMGLSLEDYAAQTGQSVDSVRGKYYELESAQNIVMENARQAYKTAGMSMNEYMDTATQFSAALVSSVGGDTIKAAELTDVAMRSISDNFNTFGGDIENIKNAYKGFAKQNYTMLDNLKLGYGGTKTEMERLIKDANEYAATIGMASNLTIDSFADVVTAIDLVQQKQQIAGTTQREAASTIQGSLKMTQAAWENLITGLSDSEADLNDLMNKLIDSASTLLTNLIPVIERALQSAAEAVKKLGPMLSKLIPTLIRDLLPTLLQSALSLITDLAAALPSILMVLIETIPKLFAMIGETLSGQLPLLGSIFTGLGNIISGVFSVSIDIIGTFFNFIKDNGPAIVGVATTIGAAFAGWKIATILQGIIPHIISLVTEFIGLGVAALASTGPIGLLTSAVEVLDGVLLANPIGLIVAALVALVAAIGVAVYHIATEEEAVKSLDDAQKSLNDAITEYASAEEGRVSALDKVTEAQDKLAAAEERSGINGQQLFQAVQEGRLAYENMNAAQKEVYKAYLSTQSAAESLKEAEEKAAEASHNQLLATIDLQTTQAKATGDWDTLADTMLNAYNNGQIGAEELQEKFAIAMTEMDSISQNQFVNKMPEDLRFGTTQMVKEQETFSQHWGNQWDGLCKAWEELFGNTTEDILEEDKQTHQSMQDMWKDIDQWFTDLFEGAKQGIENAWNSVVEWFQGVWNGIVSAFDGAGVWFSNKFQEAWNNITGIFVWLGGWFGDRWNDITNVFSSVGSWFSSKFTEAYNNITGAFAWIGGYFSGVWQDIKDAFDLQDVINWGRDMIDNFIEGIKEKMRALKDAVKSMAQTIKDNIGFSEPDEGPLSNFHTFAPDMIDLWNKGIKDNLYKVRGTMDEMAQVIADAPTKQLTADLESSLGNIQSNMQLGINTNLTDLIATESDRVTLNFYDTQTSPDAIYQKFYQQQTFGLARAY